MAARNGLFKIGKAANLKNRIAQIKSASPIECEILGVVQYDDTVSDLEKELHIRFDSKRVRGEWFALNTSDLLSIVSDDSKIISLLEGLQSLRFFELGEAELSGNTPKAALYRIEALA